MARDLAYDLLVYHDVTDTRHDTAPHVGTDAGSWFGDAFKGMSVVAMGPGIHAGRSTVVLAHGYYAMPQVQALLDRSGPEAISR